MSLADELLAVGDKMRAKDQRIAELEAEVTWLWDLLEQSRQVFDDVTAACGCRWIEPCWKMSTAITVAKAMSRFHKRLGEVKKETDDATPAE